MSSKFKKFVKGAAIKPSIRQLNLEETNLLNLLTLLVDIRYRVKQKSSFDYNSKGRNEPSKT